MKVREQPSPPGRPTPPLSEPLQIVHRDVVSGQEEQAVQQRAGITGRQYEPIAIEPLRILRIVPEVTRPEHVRHRRGTHRHARMSGVRPLHDINRQHPDRVDADLILVGHACLHHNAVLQLAQLRS